MLAVGRDMARDYGTFARAVDGLDARAIIVASERNLTDVKVPENVELRLDVSYPELRELYAGAACVVLPTRREGYHYGADCSGQTVLLDAMAMGRPVVASERSTLSDYVRDPETALIVPAEDPPAHAGGNRAAARRPRAGREPWRRRAERGRARADDAAHGAAAGADHHRGGAVATVNGWPFRR